MHTFSGPNPDSHAASGRRGLGVSRLELSRSECRICTALTFTLAAGERLELTGPNGSGKTSLLRVLAGLSDPQAGDITWRGCSRDERYWGELTYIAHKAGFKQELSPRENLLFYAGIKSAENLVTSVDIERALKQLDLAQVADVPCAALSEGQRRRASLARLPVERSALWLLDEPAAALDHAGIAVLETLLAGHAAQGGVVVVATHQPLARTGAVQHLELPLHAATDTS